jgi:hypothetical protein
MGNQLRPGGMGPQTPETGKPADFTNSMAEAMETALNDLLAADGKDTFTTDDNSPDTRDRRRLFVAIARGMVEHLSENQGAFVIKYTGNPTEENVVIQTDPSPVEV